MTRRTERAPDRCLTRSRARTAQCGDPSSGRPSRPSRPQSEVPLGDPDRDRATIRRRRRRDPARGVVKRFGDAEPAVRLEGVEKRYGDVVAVAGIDLDVARRRVLLDARPVGSGKTTTLRMIAGLRAADAPAGSCSTARTSRRVPPFERDVNTVFQDYALFPHMTVGDNVGLRPDGPQGRPRPSARRGSPRRCGWSASRATSGASRASSRAASGSGSRSRARSSTGRACCSSTSRSARSTSSSARRCRSSSRPIQQQVGITFIYVTHDQEEALTMSDRLAVFNQRPDRAGRRAGRGLRAARDAVRRRVRRDLEPAHRRGRGRADHRARPGTFTVRPEKIRLADAGRRRSATTRHRRGGRIRDVVYLGPDTRYVVALDAGARARRHPAEPGDDLDRGARPAGQGCPPRSGSGSTSSPSRTGA